MIHRERHTMNFRISSPKIQNLSPQTESHPIKEQVTYLLFKMSKSQETGKSEMLTVWKRPRTRDKEVQHNGSWDIKGIQVINLRKSE